MASIPAKQLYGTLIGATLVALMCSAPMMGLFLPFIVFVQALCIPFLIWVYFKRPELRKLYAVKSAIWILVPIAIFGSHFVQYKLDRARADEIVSSIDKFMAANNRCPNDLEELGYSKETLRERLMLPRYSCSKDSPHPRFNYSVGFAPFAMYEYDFAKQKWNMND